MGNTVNNRPTLEDQIDLQKQIDSMDPAQLIGRVVAPYKWFGPFAGKAMAIDAFIVTHFEFVWRLINRKWYCHYCKKKHYRWSSRSCRKKAFREQGLPDDE